LPQSCTSGRDGFSAVSRTISAMQAQKIAATSARRSPSKRRLPPAAAARDEATTTPAKASARPMDFTPRQPLARDQDMGRQRQPDRHGVEQDGGARHGRQVEREEETDELEREDRADQDTRAPGAARQGQVDPRQRIQA
jgi:hypothetical protein